MSTIIIEIPLNGQIKVEVEGAKGKSCLKETEELERVLGKAEETKFKKEYYEREQAESNRTVRSIR